MLKLNKRAIERERIVRLWICFSSTTLSMTGITVDILFFIIYSFSLIATSLLIFDLIL